MPQVSVVTSVYNGEAYLEECVNSILNQTFKDFEYIILNNGSTDRTPEILMSYSDPSPSYYSSGKSWSSKILEQGNIFMLRRFNGAFGCG